MLCLVLAALQSTGQPFQEVELPTTLNSVTVFLQGAQITRNGNVQIPQGTSEVMISGLSPYIDEKSIQVQAEGAFTILAVNHGLNYLEELKKDEEIDQLTEQLEGLEQQITRKNSRLQVLGEKQSLLDENKNLGGETTGVSLSELKQAIDFYDRELTTIKSEMINVRMEIDELQEQEVKIEQQISEVRGREELPVGEIKIRVEAQQSTKGNFALTYIVANAGWYPKYDVRVASIDKPLELQYKADVYQNTGVDWEQVKLSLSNGNPNQSGVAPELQTWYLNFTRNTIFDRPLYGASIISGSVRSVSGRVTDEYGDALPGVNVIVKGTTVGTTTDLNGKYNLTLPNGATYLVFSYIGMNTQEVVIASSTISPRMQADVTQLEEVVVAGYGLQGRAAGVQAWGYSSWDKEADVITTTVVQNQTTVEFEVDKPYSIKSNGAKLSVNLQSYEIEALYEYHAVPKLETDAFLIARIAEWDQYNLLEGEANLYFEDAFVGRSVLDARALVDTLDISLGHDRNIVIGRTKVDTYTKRRTVGSNQVDSRGFKILVRNKKEQPIKLMLFDQLPVAAISDISISPSELSGGRHDEKTGQVVWELNMEAQEQMELQLAYDVKFPKKEKVTLE